MKRVPSVLAMLLFAGFAASAVADGPGDRPEHFKGEPSPTLSVALKHLAEYNEKLSALVAKDSLDARELYEVHQITYTLENALERIREDLEEMAEALEDVHVASENNDPERVKSRGKEYLEATNELLQRKKK